LYGSEVSKNQDFRKELRRNVFMFLIREGDWGKFGMGEN